jgi:cytochrome c peroxidase
MSMFVSAWFVSACFMRSLMTCACLLLVASPALAGDPPIARALLAPELAALNDEELARIGAMSPLPALPADPTNRVADSLAAAQLGHRLFFDKRLSPKGISCASCHDPVLAFTDAKPLAQGIATARRNTPTILDAARRRWNGWDGKFDSLWSQALSPLENPMEMGSSRARLLQVVRDDPDLRARYNAIFGDFPSELSAGAHDPLAHELAAVPATVPSTVPSTAPAPATQSLIDATTANVLKSLGAYQRKLLSGPAPIDRFVDGLNGKQGGDLDALSPAARRGLATFVSKGGCYQCHRGPSFTDRRQRPRS